MNTVLKTSLGALASIPLMISAALAATTLGFETPTDAQSVSGRIQVSGWAVDPLGIKEVKFYIDGSLDDNDLPYGSNRADIGRAFPDIDNSDLSGFGATYNSRRLSNGPHVIRVDAENNIGEKTSETHTIVVSNEPGPAFPPPGIDLSNATARITNGIIFLDNVLIDGTLFNNLDLVFDVKDRKFTFAAFGDDLNGDGYRDDDLDQDGFYDDDLDEDGFRDDDDNDGVQPGVPMALAEIKGTVISVNGTTIVISSNDPEHGGQIGNVTVDITDAVIDDSLIGGVSVNDTVEAKGAWDGSVLTAVYVGSHNEGSDNEGPGDEGPGDDGPGDDGPGDDGPGDDGPGDDGPGDDGPGDDI